MSAPRLVWVVELRGGPYDGWKGTPVDTAPEPPEVAIAFRCPSSRACRAHVTFDTTNPYLPIPSSEAYRLREADHAARHAIYEHGDVDPALDERLRERELMRA